MGEIPTRLAGSNRSGRGGNEAIEAFGVVGRKSDSARIRTGEKDHEILIVVDSSGKVIADSMNGAQKGLDISGRPYFQMAKSGQTVISDPVISKASGKLVTPIAVPVKDDKGQVAAVMASVLKIDYLTDHIMNVKIGQTGYPYIISKEGLIIAHPDKEKILKNSPDMPIATPKRDPNITQNRTNRRNWK